MATTKTKRKTVTGKTAKASKAPHGRKKDGTPKKKPGPAKK